MDSTFIILVAAPLAFFLVVLVAYTVRVGSPEDQPVGETNTDAHDTPANELTPVAGIAVAEPASGAEPQDTSLTTVPAALAESTRNTESADAAQSHEASAADGADATLATPNVQESSARTDASPETAEPEKPAAATDKTPAEPAGIIATDAAAENLSAEPNQAVEPTAAAAPPSAPEPEPDEDEAILSGEPLILPSKGSPKFAFDYRGRLWVEKKNKGFFKQLRRPQLPPDEPQS